MYYAGESNVPGAPGNLFAGGNFMGVQGSAINPEAFKLDSSSLIGSFYPGTQAVGNMGGLMAQPYSFGFDGKYVS